MVPRNIVLSHSTSSTMLSSKSNCDKNDNPLRLSRKTDRLIFIFLVCAAFYTILLSDDSMNTNKSVKVNNGDEHSEIFLRRYLRDGGAIGAVALPDFSASASKNRDGEWSESSRRRFDQDEDAIVISSINTVEDDGDESNDVVENLGIDMETSVIFIMSFGESAAKSSLVERCILSMRRRGEYAGKVILLTDAPVLRYEGVFDENVIVVTNKEEDMMNGYFSAGAMKYKRFKTTILDYIAQEKSLENISWIFYMDIDILMGAPFSDLVKGINQKYILPSARGVEKSNSDEEVSKLYLFKDQSGQSSSIGNSGFIIMNRYTSEDCLDLWQEEIDSHPESRFDSAVLATVVARENSKDDRRCKVIAMEMENYISYPTNVLTLQEMMNGSTYTSLIHIMNSFKASTINADVTKNFVSDVLRLSPEEKEYTKFGKSIVHPSWDDWRNKNNVDSLAS